MPSAASSARVGLVGLVVVGAFLVASQAARQHAHSCELLKYIPQARMEPLTSCLVASLSRSLSAGLSSGLSAG